MTVVLIDISQRKQIRLDILAYLSRLIIEQPMPLRPIFSCVYWIDVGPKMLCFNPGPPRRRGDLKCWLPRHILNSEVLLIFGLLFLFMVVIVSLLVGVASDQLAHALFDLYWDVVYKVLAQVVINITILLGGLGPERWNTQVPGGAGFGLYRWVRGDRPRWVLDRCNLLNYTGVLFEILFLEVLVLITDDSVKRFNKLNLCVENIFIGWVM